MSDAADRPPALRRPSGEAKDAAEAIKSPKVTEPTRAMAGGRYVARLLKASATGRAALGGLLLIASAWATVVPACAEAPINLLPVVSDSEVCLLNIRGQERQHRIPVGLLTAIGLTESGRTVTHGHRTVWPWTVNAAGEGHFFETKKDAVAFVAEKQAAGVDSIDVGCMQVNLKHHPDAFASLDDAFDPATNVAYAADFLTGLRAELNSWIGAARRYHSATPELGDAYGEVVLANWTGPAKQQELTGAPIGTPAGATALAANTAPASIPTGILPTTNAAFLRGLPPSITPTAGLSLFSQFYSPTAVPLPRASFAPASPAAGASTGKGAGVVSLQKVFPRRVVPGQTGLTLQDYRVN